MAKTELRDPPASLRSLGGEPFGRRDYLLVTLYGAVRQNRDSLNRSVLNCMDLNKLDKLSQELERAALAVERCEKELAEVRKDGIADDEFEKLDEINATLAAAAERFETVTMELKRLSKNKS